MLRIRDPPTGMCWACLDCDHRASLAENAEFHMMTTKHQLPTLRKLDENNLDRMEEACSQPKRQSA